MLPFLIASLLISPWISLFLHEAAHVAAACLTGLQLREIRIGRGPTIYRTVLFGADTQVGLVPLGGWVETFPQLYFSRRARLLFFAAGPVADLIWFGILYLALQSWWDAETAIALLLPALVVQAMMVLANVVPRTYG